MAPWGGGRPRAWMARKSPVDSLVAIFDAFSELPSWRQKELALHLAALRQDILDPPAEGPST